MANAAAADSAESAARNLAERLMASGHERPEGDRCPICFDLIELVGDAEIKDSGLLPLYEAVDRQISTLLTSLS